ncbi:unnamed protein product [Clonostachys chloroleuca]|uniref:Cellobiose dehydrogenase cytochrome domain-containing protein n=1 Tax=Clonostachys chloroleuca TaxID=1926264 RepID=A0AA35LR75_9HYPO|nr:unnamed protein product [Clonostachys chloroleuca]
MQRLFPVAGALALLSIASAQTAGTYCDGLNRCFASYTLANGIVYGVAIPEATEAPFDVILQITAPTEIGWAGLSWSSGMTNNPLTIAWPNGDEVVVSSRAAVSYSLPAAWDGATLAVLDGSTVNATHWVATIHCKGCSQWDELKPDNNKLDPNAQNVIAYAYSSKAVNTPSDPNSSFSAHDEASPFGLDFTKARSSDFESWIPGEPQPTGTPTPTSASSTTIPTPTSDVPAPTGELPIPTSCSLNARFPLVAADGWSFVKLAGSLTNPRAMAVDSLGNLLVVEVSKGVSVHSFGSNGCLTGSKTLIAERVLTHGIALTPDRKTLLVSSIDTVWKYDYDAETQSVSNKVVVVKDMYRGTHSTRTLVVPPKTPNLLVVSLGSHTNLDMPAFDKNTGRAIVKVFDLSQAPEGGYTYNTQGTFLGYGLRNEVAIAVDPNNMVWGVENSADDFARVIDGKATDIHENNPAEELNYLGDPSVSNENWYGYPTCFTAWGGDEFPDGNFTAGVQFIPEPNSTWTDQTCQERSTGPRLSIQAHSAPIDAKFDAAGENLYVTLHGSWNRDVPTGYKVVTIPFTTGGEGGYEPVADRHSKEGYVDLLWDPQEGCDSSKCFRPSGITWDRDQTRLIVASDNGQEGELYILSKAGWAKSGRRRS